MYLGTKPEPVSPEPGPARRSMGPGWHGTGVQAVLGPHPRPTGRHGTAHKITAGP